MTPEQEKMLKETHDNCQAVMQLLKGYNGHLGLLGDFEECRKTEANYNKEAANTLKIHIEDDIRFRREFYKFRLWVYVAIAFAAGGGGAVGAGLSRFFMG